MSKTITLDDLVSAEDIPHSVLTNQEIAWFDEHGACLKIGDLQPGTIAMMVADLLMAHGYTIVAPSAGPAPTEE